MKTQDGGRTVYMIGFSFGVRLEDSVTNMNELLDILTRIRPEADFNISTDFVGDGLLDSFDIVALVADLDAAYGISIPGSEITPEHFRNAEAILGLVSKCRNSP